MKPPEKKVLSHYLPTSCYTTKKKWDPIFFFFSFKNTGKKTENGGNITSFVMML